MVRLNPNIPEEAFQKFERYYLYMLISMLSYKLSSINSYVPDWDLIMREITGIDVVSLGVDSEDILTMAKIVNDTLDSIRDEITKQA